MTTDEVLAQILQPWRQVTAKADEQFARTFSTHRRRMRCAEGCADCCVDGLSVMLIEALALVDTLRRLPPERLEHEDPPPSGPRCALLRDDRCLAYAARPTICRTHGLPIAESAAGAEGETGISCCPLNFVEGELPVDAVLDGERLTAILAVADGIARRALGIDAPLRVPIRELLDRGVMALPRPARRLF